MTTKHAEPELVRSTSSPADEASSSVEELAALYAAGALTDPERIDIERHLADGDEAMRKAVRSWDEIVAMLGTTLEPATPDPRIKASLLARLQPEQAETVSEMATSRVPTQIVHRADGAGWRSAGTPGASVRVLNADRKRGRMTTLMKIDPGCRFPSHPHQGDEECLIISGDMIDGHLVLGPGDYVRSVAGTHHDELTTLTGCLCLIVSLMDPQLAR